MVEPRIRKSVVQSHRDYGYWIESFKIDPDDPAPSLIAYIINPGKPVVECPG